MREAVILAGGLGTRLRSTVPGVPKPMAPVAGRPFLEILLGSLRTKGIERAVLSVGYLADSVIDHFGHSFRGMELAYAVESEPLGTGGALRLALARCVSDHAFVFNGDTFLDLDLDGVARLWRSSRTPIIVARHVEDTSRYGRLIASDGRVLRFEGKAAGGPGLINAGCYVVPSDLLAGERFPERFSFEQDFLASAVEHERFSVFISDGKFIDIGVPDDYLRAQVELADIAG